MATDSINSALRLLTKNMENGILPENKLIQKHPKGKTASQDILLNGPLQNSHPVKFQSIDEEVIRKAVVRNKGGSGLLHMDADGWRRILAFRCQVVISVTYNRGFSILPLDTVRQKSRTSTN